MLFGEHQKLFPDCVIVLKRTSRRTIGLDDSIQNPKTQSEGKGLDLKAPCGFGISSALFLPLCRSKICICLVPDYFAIVWEVLGFPSRGSNLVTY